ncbi:hypothetical protein C8R46DRAFT_437389 [Mycena filopes]|nr:hypothetical protein C8R46DRAFT_437389 [Mycena filopes]
MFTSSSSASSSTVSLLASSRASSTQSQPKDYSAAFASLQSNYGLAGTAPSVCSKKSSGSKAPKTATALAPAPAVPTTQKKDYQSAFGALSSQFGFGMTATPKYQAA